MLTMTTAQHAAELRHLLASGALRAVGAIDTLHGLSADAELATRIVLAHLEYLTDLEMTGTAVPAPWRAVEEDLASLHAGLERARRVAGAPG